MDPREFEQRLEQVVELRRPRPEWHFRDSEEYRDPSLRVESIPREPRPCRYCPREHATGRYTVRRSRVTDQWIISCGQCRRSFPRPKTANPTNK